ncbi:site-2 protease family protein [Burkholderia anthina]|uniref:site-2 protease family protein n=1 Tax=Burkholderia anthina TaxID=179879 RepID=UPI003C7A5FBC
MLVVSAWVSVPVFTVIHELGHLLVGIAFGAPISELRLGGGKQLLVLQFGPNFRLLLGWMPFTGHVEFTWLPISRRQRIAMYAAGVGATFLAAAATCAFPLHGQTASQAGVLLVVILSGLENLSTRHPQSGRWSDGEAIRGLLKYKKTL